MAGHQKPRRGKTPRLVTIRLAWGKQGLMPCKPTSLAGKSTMCNVYVYSVFMCLEKGDFPVPCAWEGHDWMLTACCPDSLGEGGFLSCSPGVVLYTPYNRCYLFLFCGVMKHMVGVRIEIAVSMMGYVDANLASLLKFPRSIPLPRNRTCVIRQSRFRPAANSGSSS